MHPRSRLILTLAVAASALIGCVGSTDGGASDRSAAPSVQPGTTDFCKAFAALDQAPGIATPAAADLEGLRAQQAEVAQLLGALEKVAPPAVKGSIDVLVRRYAAAIAAMQRATTVAGAQSALDDLNGDATVEQAKQEALDYQQKYCT